MGEVGVLQPLRGVTPAAHKAEGRAAQRASTASACASLLARARAECASVAKTFNVRLALTPPGEAGKR